MIAISALVLAGCSSDKSQNMNTKPELPHGLKLEADPDFSGDFSIRDDDGFAIVGKGVTYRDIDLQVTRLVGYGVRQDTLAAEVLDGQSGTRFIKLTKLPSPVKQPFAVAWAEANEVKGNTAYAWVDLPPRKQ